MVETGSRSTILKPLGVALSMLLSATILAFYLKLPSILGVVFSAFTGITLTLYLVTYVYCLINDRESLRSEKYSIQRLAIEKGFVGDSLQGIFEAKQVQGAKSHRAQPEEPQAERNE
jgi:hypothetical protein